MTSTVIENHRDSFRMLRGGVDLDGVVAELVERTIKVAREKYGCKTEPGHQFCNYDISIGSDITHEIFREIFASEGFYRDADVMTSAVDALKFLYERGFQLNIITSRPNNDYVRPETLMWLAEKEVPFDSIHILTKHNNYEGVADAKAVIATGLGLGWVVEDSPSNARAFAKVCDVVYLVRASYNDNEPMPENVVRIHDLWDMAYDLLDRTEKLREAQTAAA